MYQKQLLKQKQQKNICLQETFNQEENLRSETKVIKNGFVNKVLISVGFVLATFTAVNAQMNWGVKFGANASTQSEIGNICDDNGLKVGLNTGVIAKFEIKDWMAVKSGIEYQGKGKKCDSNELQTEGTDNLHYLVLPLKAEFSAGEKAGFKNGNKLFFATGPYFGYLLNAKQTIQDNTTDLTGLNDLDFGWSFELGFEFPVLKSNALQVSLNYDMGISEIVTESDMQNKSASLNLGFIF